MFKAIAEEWFLIFCLISGLFFIGSTICKPRLCNECGACLTSRPCCPGCPKGDH